LDGKVTYNGPAVQTPTLNVSGRLLKFGAQIDF
jgi:hypothetical protein